MSGPPGVPATIAVIGAGTMGTGIAQLAAEAGARTLLHDPVPEALERGIAGIGAALDRLVAKGRRSAEQAAAVRERIAPAATLEELAPAGLVIEAAPERLELKLELFGRLAAIVAPDAVLATNTSSLSVTEIAAGTPGSERVVGLHFFNPAPVMKLVEVVAGEHSSPAALAVARATGEAMGKHVVDAADVAGFLVNRVNRPFSLEALRLLQERIADVATIDRIVRQGGGFRMGPFELMDLIGIETNHAVAEAFQRQTYGEPRYQPSPLAARKIQAGQLGRKSGHGWFAYADGTPHRPADEPLPAAGGGDGRTLAIAGALPIADELRQAAEAAGFAVVAADGGGPEPWLTIDARVADDGPLPAGPRALLLARGSLHQLDPTAAGFHALAPLAPSALVEVTSTVRSAPAAVERLAAFVTAIGRRPQPVADAPGLALGRIVAQLINEAAFLIGEGNGTPDDVDAGMRLGVNHPRGPVAWSRALGLEHVVAILDALVRERGEPRYRVAPLLRQRLAVGLDLAAPDPAPDPS
ncbi:3-hydroxyacyl-CoA dehydrogenase NAD-binding domain-containing protein [Patulibacter defluvii]|uniref:3-hydroxyacyl-CoA dehydrogenase NAD-binding domain-containing protein n=1 Tax=Patulibacter defluvii TaxID=3095358 RepID=UPI002A75F463|nr:3-hydroxyacyl-CoA dehydrogenase NAD-binding domain-containing protein [Patulibacter sp. DM4]